MLPYSNILLSKILIFEIQILSKEKHMFKRLLVIVAVVVVVLSASVALTLATTPVAPAVPSVHTPTQVPPTPVPTWTPNYVTVTPTSEPKALVATPALTMEEKRAAFWAEIQPLLGGWGRTTLLLIKDAHNAPKVIGQIDVTELLAREIDPATLKCMRVAIDQIAQGNKYYTVGENVAQPIFLKYHGVADSNNVADVPDLCGAGNVSPIQQPTWAKVSYANDQYTVVVTDPIDPKLKAAFELHVDSSRCTAFPHDFKGVLLTLRLSTGERWPYMILQEGSLVGIMQRSYVLSADTGELIYEPEIVYLTVKNQKLVWLKPQNNGIDDGSLNFTVVSTVIVSPTSDGLSPYYNYMADPWSYYLDGVVHAQVDPIFYETFKQHVK